MNIDNSLIDCLGAWVNSWIKRGFMTSQEHLILLVPEDWPLDNITVNRKRIRCIRCENISSYTYGENMQSTIYLVRKKDWTHSQQMSDIDPWLMIGEPNT